jgi:hypothetical protein
MKTHAVLATLVFDIVAAIDAAGEIPVFRLSIHYKAGWGGKDAETVIFGWGGMTDDWCAACGSG